MNPKYRGVGRFLRTPFAFGVLAVVIAVLVGAAFVFVFFVRTGSEGPNSTAAPTAQPSSNGLRIYLTPSDGGARSLSLVNTGQVVPVLAQVPLIYSMPKAQYLRLREQLWSQSSMTFAGTGFSGAWPDEDEARLVLQLNGPIKIADYFHCFAIKINGEEDSWSCGDGFKSFEFVGGGYTAVIGFQAPLRLEPSDRVEIAFILGTSFSEGEKTIPNLVYGGNVPLRTSYLEIGSRLD